MTINPDAAITWLIVIIGGGIIYKIIWYFLVDRKDNDSGLKEKVEILDRSNLTEHKLMRDDIKAMKNDFKSDMGEMKGDIKTMSSKVDKIFLRMPKRIGDSNV
jgi:hypothetical protein